MLWQVQRFPNAVTQIGNLLYRRLPVCGRDKCESPADCQSAIQQVANLRYAEKNRGGVGPAAAVSLTL